MYMSRFSIHVVPYFVGAVMMTVLPYFVGAVMMTAVPYFVVAVMMTIGTETFSYLVLLLVSLGMQQLNPVKLFYPTAFQKQVWAWLQSSLPLNLDLTTSE